MELEVQNLDVKAGKPIVTLNKKDARKKSIFLSDRVKINDGEGEVVAVVDISDTLEEGKIMIFEETREALGVENGDMVNLEVTVKPQSIEHIKKKISGKELNKKEIKEIIDDTVSNRLTDPELMGLMVAMQMSDFSFQEAEHLTKSMIDSGDKIDFENALNKHCIGGVPGNRTTPLVVPIIAAAGYKIPKTSSRAITSPAGTADVMEVLTDINFKPEDIEDIVEKTNGCMVWGGSMDLAPADEEFIRVRDSLNLDPLETVVSSVLAKKRSVGSNHVLIDIPLGKEAKVTERDEANRFSKYFKKLGDKLGMNVYTVISDGSQPIGNGMGPALEARDVLRILESNGERGPQDLKDKSLMIADTLLERVGSDKKAEDILKSGKAYEKMKEIIEAQGGGISKSDEVELGSYKKTIEAEERGKVDRISNNAISQISRTVETPQSKGSGIYLHKKVGDSVEKGNDLYTVYSENERKLEKAVERAKKLDIYRFKPFV